MTRRLDRSARRFRVRLGRCSPSGRLFVRRRGPRCKAGRGRNTGVWGWAGRGRAALFVRQRRSRHLHGWRCWRRSGSPRLQGLCFGCCGCSRPGFRRRGCWLLLRGRRLSLRLPLVCRRCGKRRCGWQARCLVSRRVRFFALCRCAGFRRRWWRPSVRSAVRRGQWQRRGGRFCLRGQWRGRYPAAGLCRCVWPGCRRAGDSCFGGRRRCLRLLF